MIGGFYQREWDDFSFKDSLVNSPELSYSVRGADGTLSEYAGFSDATLYFSPRFDFTAGYRYSRLQQREDHFFGGLLNNPTAPEEVRHTGEAFSEAPSTYLAAARYHASADLMLYARAASGYRPGGGRTLPPGTPPGFSDHYTSDKIWSYELGAKFRGLDGRLSIDVDTFWIDWSHIQSLQPIPGTPYLINANAGSANSRGLEIESTFVPATGFTLGLYGAYTNARFTQTVPSVANSGDTLTYVPKVAWSAYSRFERPVRNGWNAFIAGDYRFVGYRLDTYRMPLPGYGIWDARAGLQKDGFQVTLYVRNLTNKYAHEGSNLESSTPEQPYAFVIDTPKTIGLSAVQTF
jgi:outer membrane receptor protein involved in Fe transport